MPNGRVTSDQNSVELTSEGLKDYFVKRLANIERNAMGADRGQEPEYPMLVLFLGEKSMMGYSEISNGLFNTWPQYENEIDFLGVEERDGELEVCRLSKEGRVLLDQDEIDSIETNLTDVQNHFIDRDRQILYFVIETSGFQDGDELDASLELIDRIQEELYLDEQTVSRLTFVLLDERGRNRRFAAKLRNRLTEYCAGGDKSDHGIIVLSNRMHGNATDRSRNTVYRIIASMITLTNNVDDEAQTVFMPGVYTVGFAREEKPSADIAQIVVREIIDFYNGVESVDIGKVAIGSVEFSKRLGLNADGHLQIMDEFVENELLPLLPSEDQIELFPRWEMEYEGPLYQLTAKQLDDYTMGTWSLYLQKIVEDANEKMRLNGAHRDHVLKQYRSNLCESFTTDELIYMADHEGDIRELFNAAREPSPDLPCMEFAKHKLSMLAAASEEQIDMFVSAIMQQSHTATGFRQVWKHLVASLLHMHRIKDRDLVAYYQQKDNHYFDVKGRGLKREFREVTSVEELQQLLEKTVDGVIDSDPIFTLPFDKELEERLKRKKEIGNVPQYIRERLVKGNKSTYLDYRSSLNQKLFSAMLLKQGTDLYKSLKNHLANGSEGSTYFYNTGYGSAVESLTVYELEPQNLLVEEGR